MIIQEEQFEIVEESKNNNQNPQLPVKKSSKKKIFFYFFIFFLIIFLIFVIAFISFSIYNLKHSSVITKGISIYGIDVSDLTPIQAKEKLSETFI